ncbi:unnamed protein product [Oikopleura dioica]|uniref:Ig-like domain-containing protein n=1 Tax=Oikopleura dioica TaxID=34765 RepID=E4YEV8_OIKDI|nr:unnamed protein product [Oikopleura dioica]
MNLPKNRQKNQLRFHEVEVAEQAESVPASDCESAASDNEEALEPEEEPIPAVESKIRVLQPLEDIETDIDEYIMLQCEFDSEGEVSWTLDDGALPSSTVVRQVGSLAKIRIRQVTSNDFGEYTATVKDARGAASTKCVLSKKGSRKASARQAESEPDAKSADENNEEEVGSAPRISELSNMTIKEGDDLQLELKVDSPSGYEVSWLYNDQVFQADDENMTVIDKFPELTRLILKDVIEEDSGDYVVKVTNEFGSSVSQCRVDVILLADPPKFLSAPDEVDCQFGSLVQIKFAAENATHGTLIVTDELKIPASINSDGVGQVDYEAAEDSPDYAVLLLVGAGGEAEHKVVFNLSPASKAPCFTERLHETRAEEGDSVLLEVAASGNPEPQFAWFKGDENLNISGPRLQLENISLEDAGRFSISNCAGSDKSTATLEVSKKPVKPSFINYPDNQTRHAGASIDLACSFDGIPDPKVNWFFENKKIDSTCDNGSSVIKIQLLAIKCEVEADPEPELVWIIGNKEIRESSSAYKLSKTKKEEHTFEYTLEIASVSAKEKGKAQVKAQNKNAALTCPFTIILNEEAGNSSTDDLRGNLKNSRVNPPRVEPVEPAAEQKDFRTLLKKSTKTPPAPKPASNKPGQIDFRNQLKNSVQTKAVTQDELRAHSGEQVDFRKSLKNNVTTKTLEQDELKKVK